jgi:hypothetical protein
MSSSLITYNLINKWISINEYISEYLLILNSQVLSYLCIKVKRYLFNQYIALLISSVNLDAYLTEIIRVAD